MTRPAVFSDETLDDAIARASHEGRIVLLDMTASWCQPCRVMDRTTWPDAGVERWIREHAIALQLDVDVERETAERFRVRAMPTVIALRGGAEIDRVSGRMSAERLLAWLGALREGRTLVDTLRETLANAPNDVKARWELAQRLLETGDLDGATDELVWFWEHALEHAPSFVGVRGSYAVELIGELAGRSERARRRFAELRDRAGAEIDRADVARRVLEDWLALSRALDQRDEVLAWAARVADGVLAREDLGYTLSGELVPLLVAEGRWHDVARIHPSPRASLRRELLPLERMVDHPSMPPDMREDLPEIRASIAKSSCQRLAVIERALRLAGRSDDADLLVREIEASPLAETFAALRGAPMEE